MRKKVLYNVVFLFVTLTLYTQINWGQEPQALISLSGPEGNLILWTGPVLHPSFTSPEDWIGYNIYRKEEGKNKFIKVNPKPIFRLDIEDFKQKLGPDIKFFMKFLEANNSAEIWKKVKNGDKKLVKLSFFSPKLRSYLGLAYIDKNIDKNTSYTYYFVMVDGRGHESPPSSPAELKFPRLLGPSEVKANLDENMVKITWKPNPEEEMTFGYYIYRSNDPQGYFSKINKNPILIWVSENEEPRGIYFDETVKIGRIYFYYVVSIDIAGNESTKGNIAKVIVKDLTPPSIPQGLKTSSTRSGIKLNWNPVQNEDIIGYNVYRSESFDGEYEKINSQFVSATEFPEFEDFSVKPNKQYFYSITAMDRSNNESSKSAALHGIFENLKPPLPPQNISATPKEKGIMITWNPNQERDIKGYYVFRGESSGSDCAQISKLLSKEITKFFDKDAYLHPQGTYWYRVKAINITGITSFYSKAAVASPIDRIPPEKPPKFYGHPDSNSIKLFWDAPVDNTIAGYLIFRRKTKTEGFECIIPDLIPADSVRVYEDKGVKPGTVYSYYLVAVDGSGNKSEKTPILSISLANPLPSPPYNLRVQITEGGILVSWDRTYEENTAGYHIYRYTSHKKRIRITENSLSVVTTEYLDKNVKEKARYFYSIVSISLAGEEGDRTKEMYITYKPSQPNVRQ